MEEITKHILLLINTLKLGRAKTYSTSKDFISLGDNSSNINYAGILLIKIIEQYVALTYDGKPDYEIKSNNDNNNDLNALFDNNYNNIDKNIKKAVEEYFIWGYSCIIIDDSSGELVNIPANKVYVSPEDENILAIEDILDIEQKRELSKQYKVDISDNVVKYIYYSSEGVNYKYIYIPKDQKLLYLCKSINNKKNCYLESNGYSELSKIDPYLQTYEQISTNHHNALKQIKLIALCEPEIQDNVKNILKEDNVLITISNARSIDLPLNQQVQWLDNTAVANLVELYNNQLADIKNKIYEIIGFYDVYGSEDIKETEETRIASAHRVSRELSLWRYKQHGILLFVENLLSVWISFISKTKARVCLGSTNLLEKERKAQAKENAISNLLGLCNQIIQTPQDLLLPIYKEAGKLIIKDANLDKNISTGYDNFIENLKDLSAQSNPSEALEMQGAQLNLAKEEAEISLKQAQAQKAAAEANNATIEANLRPITLQNDIRKVEVNEESTDISAAREDRIEKERGIINRIKGMAKRLFRRNR